MVDSERLFTANYHRLFRYFCRAAGSAETAQDLTQEVFVRVSRAGPPSAPEDELKAHAVTFRLRWVRALDTSNTLEPPREDVELTLKPGESRPLDSVRIVQSGAKTFDGKPCTTKAASLRVSAEFPDMDRRLAGADLWLVQRLTNGQEKTQALSIRGPFNQPIPFYFDSVVEGANRLDIFGKLVADPVAGGFDIRVEAIRALANPEPEWGYQAARWFRSTLHIKPEEVVDVALPPQDDRPGTFSDRAFSIRIKPKQIR